MVEGSWYGTLLTKVSHNKKKGGRGGSTVMYYSGIPS